MGKRTKPKHSVQSPALKRGISGAILPTPPESQQTADDSALSLAMVSPEKIDNNSNHSHKSQHSKSDQSDNEEQPTWNTKYDTILAFVLDFHTTLKKGMHPYDALLSSEITAHDFIHMTLEDAEDLLRHKPGHTQMQA